MDENLNQNAENFGIENNNIQNQENIPVNPAPSVTPPPKKKNNLPLIIGLIVAAVAVVAVVLILVLGGNSGGSGGSNKKDENCDHEYGEWILENKNAECQDRKYYKECENCGKKKTKKGSDGDHEYMAGGSSSICGHSSGSFRECTICGKSEGSSNGSDPALGDKYVSLVSDAEWHWLECSECGKTTRKDAHTFNEAGICTYCEYSNNPLAGTYYISLWVSEKEDYDGYSVVKQTQQQIEAFMAANPGIIINANISGVTESDAGSQVAIDPATGPDIYCFAQDQLARLVAADALAAPGGDVAAQIRANNDAGAVAAASIDGTVYAYPMTSDNGYYLYYDKSIITNPDSLEAIIDDCNRAYWNGKSNNLFRYSLENGWYAASFFFATGCESEWIVNSFGEFVGINDNFNSEAGLIAMKGMEKLVQAGCYDSNADIFTNAAAIVTGIWNAEAAKAHFGENLGVTDLPSFTVDGKSYHLGSFSGNKLMGVKPQEDSKKAAVLQLLAQYLTSEKCQLERYNEWQWGPSNINAQNSQAVQANASLAALALQNAYAVPQGQIHGAWWDIMANVGRQAKYASGDADLWYILNEYEQNIKNLFNDN